MLVGTKLYFAVSEVLIFKSLLYRPLTALLCVHRFVCFITFVLVHNSLLTDLLKVTVTAC